MSELQITRVVEEPVGADATQFTVTMRDGVKLAGDLYLPAGVRTAPTILVRLPYDKNSRYVFFDRVAKRFTDRGYAMFVQDVRGKFRSEGATEAFEHEVEDSYDTIDWVVRQSWSDGSLGMFGDSYYGFTQWAAVASEHPALRAIVPRVTSMDLNLVDEGIGGYGRPVPWLEGFYYLATHWVDRHAYEYEIDYRKLPLTDAFEEAFAAIGSRSYAYDRRVPTTTTSNLYAAGKHPRDARPVPVLQTIGWFDNLATPHIRDYLSLAALPGWDAVQYLEAGAFDHENYVLDNAPVAEQDDHAVDEAALERMLDLYVTTPLNFFDVFVRGLGAPESLPKVRWELGRAGWREAQEWPPAGVVTRTFDLLALAAAAGVRPGGVLAPFTGGAREEEVTWVYDPDDLVPSAVTNSFAFLLDYPDESETGDRADVLVFTSLPATAPIDIAGAVELEATVATSAPTADVLVKLLDVAPDGSARMIVRGQVQIADAAEGRRIRVDLGHTGYRVRPGHALRLHIASSDFPLALPNSGTEESAWTAVTRQPSRQTLRVTTTEPARLTLNVLEAER